MAVVLACGTRLEVTAPLLTDVTRNASVLLQHKGQADLGSRVRQLLFDRAVIEEIVAFCVGTGTLHVGGAAAARDRLTSFSFPCDQRPASVCPGLFVLLALVPRSVDSTLSA